MKLGQNLVTVSVHPKLDGVCCSAPLTTHQTHLYEDIVVLHHQRADVDILGKRVVAIRFCAHLSSACDVLHICDMGREAKKV